MAVDCHGHGSSLGLCPDGRSRRSAMASRLAWRPSAASRPAGCLCAGAQTAPLLSSESASTSN